MENVFWAKFQRNAYLIHDQLYFYLCICIDFVSLEKLKYICTQQLWTEFCNYFKSLNDKEKEDLVTEIIFSDNDMNNNNGSYVLQGVPGIVRRTICE